MLTLNAVKPGDTPKKLSLNMAKHKKFDVELFWDSIHDLDAHALMATNAGSGAKVDAYEQVLSCFNLKGLPTNPNAVLDKNGDGSFGLPCGALHHSGDSRSGTDKDIDEVITVDGARIPAGVNEIPIFVTMYPKEGTNFGQVKQAGIRIKDDSGRVISEHVLSKEFAAFNGVQMGSLVLGANGWEFAEVAVGFNGGFDTILENFS